MRPEGPGGFSVGESGLVNTLWFVRFVGVVS